LLLQRIDEIVEADLDRGRIDEMPVDLATGNVLLLKPSETVGFWGSTDLSARDE
jgi:hypothetical protein